MIAFEHALILLLLVAALSVITRWLPWPPLITYLFGGAAVALLPDLPRLKLNPEVGRKAIVLLTDGEDTGSDHSLSHAIEAAQGADAVVFPIQERAGAASRNRGKSKRDLNKLASETGGVLFDGNKKSPDYIFTEIEKELRSQYVLAFTPAVESRDGKFHKLEVRVTKPKMKTRARSGYYAPKN